MRTAELRNDAIIHNSTITFPTPTPPTAPFRLPPPTCQDLSTPLPRVHPSVNPAFMQTQKHSVIGLDQTESKKKRKEKEQKGKGKRTEQSYRGSY